MLGADLTRTMLRKVSSERLALKPYWEPYWGKPAVRNFREVGGNGATGCATRARSWKRPIQTSTRLLGHRASCLLGKSARWVLSGGRLERAVPTGTRNRRAFRSSGNARTAYSPSDEGLVTSRISRLECRSKPLRDGDVALLALYDAAFAKTRFVEVTAAIIDRATEIRARYGLRIPRCDSSCDGDPRRRGRLSHGRRSLRALLRDRCGRALAGGRAVTLNRKHPEAYALSSVRFRAPRASSGRLRKRGFPPSRVPPQAAKVMDVVMRLASEKLRCTLIDCGPDVGNLASLRLEVRAIA
jgi:hypothetical protein